MEFFQALVPWLFQWLELQCNKCGSLEIETSSSKYFKESEPEGRTLRTDQFFVVTDERVCLKCRHVLSSKFKKIEEPKLLQLQ